MHLKLTFSPKKWVALFTALFLLTLFQVKAQTPSADSMSYDQLWLKARGSAYGGERKKAKSFCTQLVIRSGDPDAAVLLGRLHSWDGQYDSARTVLKGVLKNYPAYYDAVDALIDLEYWSSAYDTSASYCDLGLEKHAGNPTYLLKKAKVLNAQNKMEEAVEILTNLVKADRNNTEAKALLKSSLEGKRLN